MVRTYALAIAVATTASQFLAGTGMVNLGKSIYLQQSFSMPVLFLGGLLFGYGMVLSNGCGSRALVLLGRGNLRSFVVVVVLAIAAQMTLKGLIAPARIAVVQASQTTVNVNSLPSLFAMFGPAEALSRAMAAAVVVVTLILLLSRTQRSGVRPARLQPVSSWVSSSPAAGSSPAISARMISTPSP